MCDLRDAKNTLDHRDTTQHWDRLELLCTAHSRVTSKSTAAPFSCPKRTLRGHAFPLCYFLSLLQEFPTCYPTIIPPPGCGPQLIFRQTRNMNPRWVWNEFSLESPELASESAKERKKERKLISMYKFSGKWAKLQQVTYSPFPNPVGSLNLQFKPQPRGCD